MVAVLFHRLGPYHVARLRAAAGDQPITAIEFSSDTDEYAWTKIEGVSEFRRITLFPDGDSRAASAKELSLRLRKTLTELAPKAVAIPGWSDKGSFIALQWCGENGIPIIVMSESTEWDEPRSSMKEAIKRRIVGLASAALVGGKPHADYIAKLGMDCQRVFLGYDAVDNGYFEEAAAGVRRQEPEVRGQESGVRRQKSESKEGKGRSADYFLASARFIEKKNLPRLIEAYAKYRGEQKTELGTRKEEGTSPRPSPQSGEGVAPWDLVLLGDGPLRAQLETRIAELGLNQCAYLPGFKQYPDLPAYYGRAGAFIHASTTEQWGLVVNEAMASGLPVLVSNRCGCASDLVQEGRNGFTFDPYNVEQLAQLMLKVSHASFPRAECGQASQEIVSNWGVERFAQGLKAAAEKAIQVGAKRPSAVQRALLKGLLLR